MHWLLSQSLSRDPLHSCFLSVWEPVFFFSFSASTIYVQSTLCDNIYGVKKPIPFLSAILSLWTKQPCEKLFANLLKHLILPCRFVLEQALLVKYANICALLPAESNAIALQTSSNFMWQWI